MITVKYQDIEITVATPTEAAAVARELANSAPAVTPIANGDMVSSKPSDDARMRTALTFLTGIRDAGPDGADSSQIMHILGISHSKAIGAKAAVVNKVLTTLGYRPSAVYDNKRTLEGRFWRSGPKIADVINTLKTKTGGDAVMR